jgi:hypothetical protein
VLAFSCGAQAQTDKAAQYRPSSQVLDDWVTRWEEKIVDVAEAMPADKYSFAPASSGFKGVRTFAEQVKHAAAANYILAAAALGEKPPADAGGETGPDALRTKADITGYVKGSFAALHKAAAVIDEKNTVVISPGISPLQGTGTRLGLVVEALLHSANHYGQMVEYLRMNGVIPPASR